ncbi:hypothetical protein POM88_036147 [Heracleum sosnowskyi]|uniref:Ionotropic glutamate receptor C-terminal domain-containing protein n=1 Tax=Heracleum sosnowskyi TaxID=360622 RepID=A0AAD8HMM7_9APIA|nr:hypothetical protein POM88_036147 [Heracleum sosnowskyi]
MLTWAFLVLILTSSYTATLASMLTVQQISLAPKGADLGYDQSDVVKRYFVRSKTDGVDGIIDEMPYIKAFLSSYSPDYAMVDSGSTTNGFGFAFSKGSPLVPDISRAIAKLREDGTLEMLEKKWYNKPQSLLNQETQPKPQVLKDVGFGGLFLIGGVSLG